MTEHLDIHEKHIGYTMTLAAGIFAYTDTTFARGQTVFAMDRIATRTAGDVLAAISALALAAALAALALGILVIFGMTGIRKLDAHRATLSAELASVQIERRFDDSDDLIARERELSGRIAETMGSLERYETGLKRRSGVHLQALAAAVALAGFLFVEAKVDPDRAVPDCRLTLSAAGELTVARDCLADGEGR